LYDCPIDLELGKEPPFGPIYNLSQVELAALCGYIDEYLAKKFIQHSKSPTGAPILFVKCYPLPLILGLIDQLGNAKIYTKIDLRGAYNLIHIRK
jgi:hypothetical protein